MINFSEKQKKIVDELKAVNNATNGDVLDKIRDEILNFKEKCNASDYLGCGILEIIDKYSEEQTECTHTQ